MVAIFSFEQKIHSISTKSWVTQPKPTHYFSRIGFPLQNHGSVGFRPFLFLFGFPLLSDPDPHFGPTADDCGKRWEDEPTNAEGKNDRFQALQAT